MRADTYSLKEILSQERRFVIPTYQRDYEWTLDGHWELLFEDLEAVADRLQDAQLRAAATGDSLAKLEKQVTPHFLGAVVCDQLITPAGGIDVRAVIDGQQRLTTLQLLLRGLLDVLIEHQSPRIQQVRRLLYNPLDVVREGHEQFKLWPRRRDRASWPAAMTDGPVEADRHLYLKARAYFADRARAVVADSDSEDRTDALVRGLTDLFKLVVIDLDDNDDAQVIFEVLNGRQTPLAAADLVKNLLFLRGELADEKELDALYDRYWAPFDEEWWTAQVGRGHAARGRRDVLLSSWLTAVSGREANMGHLYAEARRYLNAGNHKTADVLAQLREYGQAYKTLYGAGDHTPDQLAAAYRRLDQLGIVTAVPLLLWLRTLPPDRLSIDDHVQAVRAMESWVVRRLIVGANTRAYGKMFVDVLNEARLAETTPEKSISTAIVHALDRDGGSMWWPTDEEITAAYEKRRFYGVLAQERIRLLLAAIDRQMQVNNVKTEPAEFNYELLQIEHIMPQQWREHWPLEEQDGAQLTLDMQRRDQAVHRIGNLTLVTSNFNKSVANRGWSLKAPELAQHSKLQLNAGFDKLTHWDEAAIDDRARKLAAVTAQVWPSPTVLLTTPD